jgi:L-alanine-DL-glutamate epimerase-like enolase superfamily enzyme
LQIQWLETSASKAGARSILLWLGEGNSFGLGEIYLAADVDGHAALQLIRASASVLGGVDLRNINVALDVVSSVTDHDAGVGSPVRSAFDTALHDLNGKLRGCPVHIMLGGRYRSEVVVARHFLKGDAITDRDGGVRAALLDYHPEPARQASSYGQRSTNGWLGVAIDRLGTTVQIDIACSSAFDNPANARTFVEGLLSNGPRQNLGLHQPLSDADLVGHSLLCTSLPVPVILDTSVRSAKLMGQIVRLSAADRVVVNLERVGGLRAATQIVSIAEAASIGVSSASFACTAIGAAAALHLAAILHDTYPSRLDNLVSNREPIADAGFTVSDGVVRLGAAPGLGVVLHTDAAAAFQPA